MLPMKNVLARRKFESNIRGSWFVSAREYRYGVDVVLKRTVADTPGVFQPECVSIKEFPYRERHGKVRPASHTRRPSLQYSAKGRYLLKLRGPFDLVPHPSVFGLPPLADRIAVVFRSCQEMLHQSKSAEHRGKTSEVSR